MKKVIIIFISILFSANLFAQTATQKIKPTTQEEYNYVTKGYKIQSESGLDMKKGYSFTEYSNIKDGARSLIIKGLLRDGEKKPCAMLLLYTNTDYSSTPFYLCLPTEDAEGALWTAYYESTATWTGGTGRWINYNLGKLLMRLADQ